MIVTVRTLNTAGGLRACAFWSDGAPRYQRVAVDFHKRLIQTPTLLDEPTPARATRLLRISAANVGPNRLRQKRAVSWLMLIPSSASDPRRCVATTDISHPAVAV